MLSKLFGARKCFICKKKLVSPSRYLDDTGKPVKVCQKCVPYAERRALRKI